MDTGDDDIGTTTPAVVEGYDRFYRSGARGFRFEEKRPMWEAWCKAHYIDEYGMEPGQRLLDLPCGEGFWASVFAKHGFEVIGVDLSKGGIEEARERYPGILFEVGNAEKPLPFPDGSFDIVFSRGISHLHRRDLFTDPSLGMMQNLMRYVRPGGLLLVSYNTRRDGSGDGIQKRLHHPMSALVKLCEEAGEVFRVTLVGNLVQIGVKHWGANRP